ncbi:LysR family transcriptional regulator [Defluviimonas salinarum]|uniref:LysR family transcriptional regulator n=1 Tax=Defluviimonas salinarum TaxID=2992147 RepID=A0ABT3J509_9RHOB|nr:LysR family transcriptional regulator [Defluviimonas salinarum]MCW3782773.1 LysR family transcriptional regulator [Defluviimonas salinarum]
MNDRPGRFDWNHVRAFLATAEEGSLSAAARVLGLTQPTLGRQVAALEDDLGLLLFERIGRSLQLTGAGRELLAHVRAMGEAANRVALAAAGQSQSIEGKVRITASEGMSAYVLPAALKRLREAAPRLEIDVVAADDIRDLMRREADIAIRHVRPEQPDLVARLVREAEAHFYAARSYLDARGRPQSLADLARHDFVGFGDNERMLDYLRPLGMPLSTANFRIGSENGIVAWELARQGFGIAPMWDELAARDPGMERILPELPPIVFPIWLATHRELHTSRRIRLVFDLLADYLGQAT